MDISNMIGVKNASMQTEARHNPHECMMDVAMSVAKLCCFISHLGEAKIKLEVLDQVFEIQVTCGNEPFPIKLCISLECEELEIGSCLVADRVFNFSIDPANTFAQGR